MEVYKNLFGLSRNAPECLPSQDLTFGPDEVTTSKSGLYLDEMDNLNLEMLNVGSDCSKGSIWDFMYQARRNASLELHTSIIAGLQSRAKPRLNPYFGNIGQEATRGTNEVAEGSTVHLLLTTKNLESVSAMVKRIGLILNSTATVSVSISGLAEPVIINAAANVPTYTTLPTPLLVPIDGRQIEISYTVSGFQPLANKTSCNCGIKDRNLAEYFEGIIEMPAFGILLDTAISCDAANLIAINYQQKPEVAAVLAYAARYKAAELLVERILSSDNINRYTMMDPEYLFSKRNHFRKEYQDRIVWLVSADSLDLSLDSCYACKNTSGYVKRGILL